MSSSTNGPQRATPVIISESGLYQFQVTPDAKGVAVESQPPSLGSTPRPRVANTPVAPARRVMTCLDGSPASECVLPLSAFIATSLDAELTLIHVMPAPHGAEPMAFDVLDWEISRREAELYLQHKSAELQSTCGITPVRTELAQGRPSARVLSMEFELLPELTILCRRGAGGVGAHDLGATAQQVLDGARGSVLLVPAGSTPIVPPKRILVALDGSSRAESVFSMVQAISHDAEIILVHVVNDPRATSILSDAEDIKLAQLLASRMETCGGAYLGALKERLAPTMPRIKPCIVRSADTQATLLEIARTEHADMIVLTAHGITCNTERSLGSVATHILHYATLPVLVVQDLPKAAPQRERHEGWGAH